MPQPFLHLGDVRFVIEGVGGGGRAEGMNAESFDVRDVDLGCGVFHNFIHLVSCQCRHKKFTTLIFFGIANDFRIGNRGMIKTTGFCWWFCLRKESESLVLLLMSHFLEEFPVVFCRSCWIGICLRDSERVVKIAAEPGCRRTLA